MDGKEVSVTIINKRDDQRDWRQEELEWTLTAIAGAIIAGKLTPDDAFAWARIAAYEAAALGRCSDMSVARSPGRSRSNPARSSWPPAESSFSTK